MFRLTQILRNSYLRLEGFLSVIFKSVLSFLSNLFGFFAKLFGFTRSDYFLESDQAQNVKQAAAQEFPPSIQNTTPDTRATIRRRSNAKKIEDYYINMAREVKKN